VVFGVLPPGIEKKSSGNLALSVAAISTGPPVLSYVLITGPACGKKSRVVDIVPAYKYLQAGIYVIASLLIPDGFIP
jgi:hypothetical protein